MTLCEVEQPFKERAGFFVQLFDLEVAESVLMEVAKEAPADYEGFYAQRPVPPEDTEGALLVVSVDGKGVPMIKEEAVKLKAKLGTGEKRQLRKSVRQTLAKVITLLLTMFGKGEQDNLTKAEQNALRRLVQTLIETWRKSHG
jgi:hypothetical protein